jgi:hypothetical protein
VEQPGKDLGSMLKAFVSTADDGGHAPCKDIRVDPCPGGSVLPRATPGAATVTGEAGTSTVYRGLRKRHAVAR